MAAAKAAMLKNNTIATTNKKKGIGRNNESTQLGTGLFDAPFCASKAKGMSKISDKVSLFFMLNRLLNGVNW